MAIPILHLGTKNSNFGALALASLAYNGTLWLFNITMEHGPFIDGLPIKNGWIFPWQTVSHNQMVCRTKQGIDIDRNMYGGMYNIIYIYNYIYIYIYIDIDRYNITQKLIENKIMVYWKCGFDGIINLQN